MDVIRFSVQLNAQDNASLKRVGALSSFTKEGLGTAIGRGPAAAVGWLPSVLEQSLV